MMTRDLLRIGAVVFLLTSTGVAGESSAQKMALAATRLLATLSETQRSVITCAFDGAERLDFHFVPKSTRKGMSIKEMSPMQLHLTHALLNESLSRTGYTKAAGIMSLEAVLAEVEFKRGRRNARDARDPMKYYVTIFGRPGAQSDWGWSFEGHHLSLNFTIVDGVVVASSPAFHGANPHRVSEGPLAGMRILGAEEDRARQLLDSLDQEQRALAIVAEKAPNDILSGARPRVVPTEPRGIPASALNPDQHQLLRVLVETYIANVPADAARERSAQLEAAGPALHFAWMGSPDVGEAHYYQVRAPTFLIEYDNIQNGANHTHTVWRDYDGDFGRDVIGEHRSAHEHE